jgi:phosphoribosyl 1,2-cyclic phosphodiesterase
MEICALASGSSGNCFYIENNKTKSAVIVDCGISAKQITERLGFIGKNPGNIKGIFITHEHSDHVRGVDVFSRKFKIPIFATKKTAESCFLCSDEELINFIKNNETVDLGGMKIEAFSKSHKAADPVSYNVFNGKRISIITDVGYGCENVITNISNSDGLFIESNYDDNMLDNGPYPYFLKKWIKSDVGHLSNFQSATAVLENASSKLKCVVLSHLSKNNNTPLAALSAFGLLKERRDLCPKVFVSERHRATQVFRV